LVFQRLELRLHSVVGSDAFKAFYLEPSLSSFSSQRLPLRLVQTPMTCFQVRHTHIAMVFTFWAKKIA